MVHKNKLCFTNKQNIKKTLILYGFCLNSNYKISIILVLSKGEIR